MNEPHSHPDPAGSAGASGGVAPAAPAATQRPGAPSVIRRNGKVTAFDPDKISVALTKAFLAVEGRGAEASSRIHEKVEQFTRGVVKALSRRMSAGGPFHIEDIQDQVELALMRSGEVGDHRVARAYIIYREDHARARLQQAPQVATAQERVLHMLLPDGSREALDRQHLETVVNEACHGYSNVDANALISATLRSLCDGVTAKDLGEALVMSARQMIEREPNYSSVAAGLLLSELQREVITYLMGEQRAAPAQGEMTMLYPDYFHRYVREGVRCGRLDPQLEIFDLQRLAEALRPERDLQFSYLGLQTLYDRYLISSGAVRIELPQAFFMRVAMGLAMNEKDREGYAILFYNLLSSFDFMSSTPTLFNSGTCRPQLSSCYLTTVADSLDGIYSAIRDDAMLSKYAGGLGNDWTNVRAAGAHIRGTDGKSQGVVPFLKVVNDTAVAVNQGGKRRGAICAYLEVWHLDIEEFLELRKNTGDDRRRTHDMNTACWVPDLFMKRVLEKGTWTLFSPDEVQDLHDLYGTAFAERYLECEEQAARGALRNFKVIKAATLWRKMLSMLYETGHPWLVFKDPCNIRSPQQHAGVVHSSNLCTEITLNTSLDEIAVCNLGSVNLARHLDDQSGLDQIKLQRTVSLAMRMLDNVIDYNYYTVDRARRSNLQHRPVGLGIMGFQDVLLAQRIPYGSEQAVQFADRSMEAISYYAIDASARLAEERGAYPSFKGSLWDRGVLPIDSIALLEGQRGSKWLQMDGSWTMDWEALRGRVYATGMRNSNCLAIAPTATISNICGVSQSIEPTYQNLYAKSNLSGEFTYVNPWLVRDLKERGLWDEVMVNDLKHYDGSVQQISRIPDELKQLYRCAFEIDPRWLIEAASRRQKWIDQAQSLNLYIARPSGRELEAIYRMAWMRGLKSTYYLRSLGATNVEKSTLNEESALRAVKVAGPANTGGGNGTTNGSGNGVANGSDSSTASSNNSAARGNSAGPGGPSAEDICGVDSRPCPLDDPGCEACQ